MPDNWHCHDLLALRAGQQPALIRLSKRTRAAGRMPTTRPPSVDLTAGNCKLKTHLLLQWACACRAVQRQQLLQWGQRGRALGRRKQVCPDRAMRRCLAARLRDNQSAVQVLATGRYLEGAGSRSVLCHVLPDEGHARPWKHRRTAVQSKTTTAELADERSAQRLLTAWLAGAAHLEGGVDECRHKGRHSGSPGHECCV